MAVSLSVNGQRYSVDVPPEVPLLWVLRDVVGLTGTKFGCGMALCGPSSADASGGEQGSCAMPVVAVKGPGTTIEGLSATAEKPTQKAWIPNIAPPCCCCQASSMGSSPFALRPSIVVTGPFTAP